MTYIAPCGHKMFKIPCSVSFKYASGFKESPKCSSLYKFACPTCLSEVNQVLNSRKFWDDETVLRRNAAGDVCIMEANLGNL